VMQEATTSDMLWSVADTIALLTECLTLEPGDVIATGTYHAGRKGLRDGDAMEIEVEGLGRARFLARGPWSPRPGAASLPQTPRAPGVADASTISRV